MDFEFDQRDLVYFRIDRRRKMLVSILLKAIGYSEEEILRSFYDFDKFTLNPKGGALWHFDVELLQNVTLPFDLKAKSGEVLVAANQRIKKSQLGKISKLAANPYPVDDEFLCGKVVDDKRADGKRLAVGVVRSDGKIVAKANAEITAELLEQIRETGATELQTLNINELNRGPYISNTLASSENLVTFRAERRNDTLRKDVVALLKAIGCGDEKIRKTISVDKFALNPKGGALWEFDADFLQNATLPFDLKAKNGEILARAGLRVEKRQIDKIARLATNPRPVEDSFLFGKRLAEQAVSADGEIVAKVGAELTAELLGKIREAGVGELRTHNINETALYAMLYQEYARIAIYRMLRPGDPPNKDIVSSYLDGIFFNSASYDMSKVGRMKFNRRLRPGAPAMQHRIWIDKDKLPPRGNLDAMAQAVVDAGQMPALEEAREFLRYVAQYSSRSLAENLTEEEARALSKKLQDLPHEILPQTTLSKEDIMLATRCLVDLRNGKGKTDDIDSLTNRRVRAVGEFVANHFQQGLMRVDRAIRDRLSRAESEKLMPHELISAKAVSGAVAEFFNGNQLSQFMDQTNPLSEITHKRRISAFGAGGLTRDRVGFEVRDVHPTHYGRVCPIETPEGQNIGLINSMSLCSNLNEYGFLQTYYFPVVNGKVGDEQVCLSALEEEGKVIVQANTPRDNKGRLVEDMVLARKDGEYVHVSPAEVDYMDVSPAQITSAAASIIPFLEHDDANRALMGSNMQRQATPCLVPEKPLVGTGVERYLAEESGTVLRARRKGRVSYVDAGSVVVEAEGKAANVGDEAGVDIYPLVKFDRSNQNTAINQRPLVNVGDKVGAGDVLADGAGTDMGELALGQNLLVAFMPWNGYNFEDSILISERVVADQRFASIHIIEEVAHARSTQLGDEEITRDIPHQSEQALRNLDEEGITRIGVEVRPGDILVGKVTPKGERQMTPEEKLLQAVFGEKANDYKDTSMRMPPGASGVVIDVKVFTSEEIKKDAERTGSARAEATSHEDLQAFIKRENEAAAFVRADAARRARALLAKHLSAQALDKLSDKDALKKRVSKDDATNEALAKLEAIVAKEDDKRAKRKRDAKNKFAKGHDLPQGILKTVKVYVAIKRNLQVGDKMAGRHGNKGVVSRVEPVESMPYLRDGTPVDIALNPLGVPSRMNVGQILETHLGLAAKGLGNQINDMLRQKRKQAIAELREFLGKVYKGDKTCSLDSLTDDELLAMAKNLSDGVPFATPVFDGAAEKDIENMLSLAQLPQTGQVVLRDGRSGEAFERPVTVGYMYIMKLHHLVDEKMHARSTGPYSLVTQQPLGGKAQGGGQRFGEMEVWALEAYGAAHTLCEMLTVKSDDVGFRVKMFENLAEGKMDLKTGIPESFNVLVQEIRSMCIDMDFA